MAKYLCQIAETGNKIILNEHNGIWSLPVPFAVRCGVTCNRFDSINELEMAIDKTIHIISELDTNSNTYNFQAM
jgi:hypothetical protein